MDGIELGPGQGGAAQPPLHARIQAYLGGVIQAYLMKVVVAVLFTMGIVGMILVAQTGPDEPAVALWCKPNVTVSAGGTHYRTISDALGSAPRSSSTIYCIHITAGRYVENLVVDYDQTNIAFMGDGPEKTVIAANRTCGNRHCELQTAALLLKGSGFIAVNLTVENYEERVNLSTAAVENWSDRSVFYRCNLMGHNNVLYAFSSRQFYRDSVIQGAGSLVYGGAMAFIQNCKIAVDASINNVNGVAESSIDFPGLGRGFTFHLCEITAVRGPLSDAPILGSAITPNGRVAYMQCAIDIQGRWATNGYGPGRDFFAVYDNTGIGAAASDDVQTLDYNGASQLSLRNYFEDGWIPTNIPCNLDLGR